VVRPEVGAVNFQTGMGGLLQTLVFGFGGARLHLDRLEILRPQLPPDTDKFTIRGKRLDPYVIHCHQYESNSLSIMLSSFDEFWYKDR
jgi:hypothetical protein